MLRRTSNLLRFKCFLSGTVYSEFQVGKSLTPAASSGILREVLLQTAKPCVRCAEWCARQPRRCATYRICLARLQPYIPRRHKKLKSLHAAEFVALARLGSCHSSSQSTGIAFSKLLPKP